MRSLLMSRSYLAHHISCPVAPATFTGMPVRVWDGVAWQERTIAPAPAPGWWKEPDAWVLHPSSATTREGILWAHDRWHLSTTVVETYTLGADHVADKKTTGHRCSARFKRSR